MRRATLEQTKTSGAHSHPLCTIHILHTHTVDGWLVVCWLVVFVFAFLICRLFVVKTVHSAKLRAFYGARRYFPLQFHYFRALFFAAVVVSVRTKGQNGTNDARTARRAECEWSDRTIAPFSRMHRPVERKRTHRQTPQIRSCRGREQKYDFHRRLNELSDFRYFFKWIFHPNEITARPFLPGCCCCWHFFLSPLSSFVGAVCRVAIA